MDIPMNFPPPPRSIMLANPDGDIVRVLAYSKRHGEDAEVQRVRWNPTIEPRGDWEVDPDVARWERNNKTLWTLVTIQPVRTRAATKLTRRVEILEGREEIAHAHLENLIDRMRVVEQEILNIKQTLMSMLGIEFPEVK